MAEAVVLFRIRSLGFVDPDDDNDDGTNLRQFIPVPGTYVFVTETDRDLFDDTDAAIPASNSVGLANALRPTPDLSGTLNRNGQNIFIQTGTDGEAKFTSD